jgi:hypothetical protein
VEEVKCLLSPERFFTKICMVSSGSADGAREEVEETLEMLLERMMAVGVSGCLGGGCGDVRVVEWWKIAGVIGKINEERLLGVDKSPEAVGWR